MKTHFKSVSFVFLVLISISHVSSAAAGVNIKDIRYQSFKGRTRVTVFLSAPVEFSMNHLSNPKRLYFDLKNTTISGKVKTSINVGDGILKAVRTRQFSRDTVRIVFDVEQAEDFRASLVNKKNPRLVIDIYASKITEKNASPDPAQPAPKKPDISSQPKEPAITAPAATKPEGTKKKREEFVSLINSGEKYVQSGEYEKALEEFEKADKLIPESPEPHVFIGRALLKLHRIDEAIKSYKEAIARDPNSADAYNGLGYSYYALGKPGSAVEAFQMAIKLNPDHDDAHAGLGYTYLTVGDIDSAMNQYRILKGLGSDKADELFSLIFKAQLKEQKEQIKTLK